MTDGRMPPVHSNLDAAPEYFIKLVRCTCEMDYSNRRSTVARSESRGVCTNGNETENDSNR